MLDDETFSGWSSITLQNYAVVSIDIKSNKLLLNINHLYLIYLHPVLLKTTINVNGNLNYEIFNLFHLLNIKACKESDHWCGYKLNYFCKIHSSLWNWKIHFEKWFFLLYYHLKWNIFVWIILNEKIEVIFFPLCRLFNILHLYMISLWILILGK